LTLEIQIPTIKTVGRFESVKTHSTPLTARVRSTAFFLICLAAIVLAPRANSEGTNSVAGNTPAVPPKLRSARHELTGAELYSMHCNRCHPERYPTERTAAQWKTILLHMRVRANLPAEHARTILKYLQENSGR
jgi:hypothetical protein